MTGVHTHKTGMDLHDQRQDVIRDLVRNKLHDEMFVKRTTLQLTIKETPHFI